MNSKKEKAAILESGPLKCFFAQGAFGTAFLYLTSGVILTGLAILMGAGDVLASYLSVILNICGVLILVFAAFLERFRSRKKLAVALTILSRAATLLIVLIPAFAPPEMQLTLFLPVVVAAFTLQAQSTVVLNQWMLGFVDEKKSGRYISLRQTLSLVVTVVLSVACGGWLDFMQGKYLGFAALFIIAAGVGICETVLLARTPDSTLYQSAGQGCKLRDMVRVPLKNRSFTGFVLYILLFYLLLTVSDSFTMVYMMKYLALPYQTVTLLYMIISLPQVILLGIWGKISDKRGHQFVLKTSVWLFAGETLFLAFSSPQSWFLFIPLAFFVSSTANAGFVISVFNRRYELMPKENRIVYDNFYTAAIGLGSILGPMSGGLVKGWLESVPEVANVVPFANIRILYLLSTVGILLLQTVYHSFQKKRAALPEGGRAEAACTEC